MKVNNYLLCTVMFILGFISCLQDKKNDENYIRWTSINNRLLKEQYSPNGIIESKQFFNHDTTPTGAKIEYYTNGVIKKWMWYVQDEKLPTSGVFYDSTGNISRFGGNPFLDVIKSNNNHIYVELINPPTNKKHSKYVVGYKDILDGIIKEQFIIDPGATDTTAWVEIDKYTQSKGHVYKLYYLCIDTVTKQIIDSFSTEINNDLDFPRKK